MEATIKAAIEVDSTYSVGISAIRYKGRWFKITPKPFEPERQTYNIAWRFLKDSKPMVDIYREWYVQEEDDAKLLYPFRKG